MLSCTLNVVSTSSAIKHSRRVRLHCPMCNRDLGAWQTVLIDGRGPGEAHPTLQTQEHGAVKVVRPNFVFECTRKTCDWRLVLSGPTVAEIVWYAARSEEKSESLSAGTIRAAKQRIELRSGLHAIWILLEASGNHVEPPPGILPAEFQPKLAAIPDDQRQRVAMTMVADALSA